MFGDLRSIGISRHRPALERSESRARMHRRDALVSKQSRRRRRNAACAYRRETRRARSFALSRLGSICQRFIRRSLRFPGSRGCTWSLLLTVRTCLLSSAISPSLHVHIHRLTILLFWRTRFTNPRHRYALVDLNRSMGTALKIGSIAGTPRCRCPSCRFGDLSAFLTLWKVVVVFVEKT